MRSYTFQTASKESLDVLKYAYLNSFYQTGLKNLLDVAVLERKQEIASLDIDRDYHKFDEIPFDDELCFRLLKNIKILKMRYCSI